MFIIEETHIENGVSTPLQQKAYHDLMEAVQAFHAFAKQTELHFITLFTPNQYEAIAQK